jgi:hypothetical protein
MTIITFKDYIGNNQLNDIDIKTQQNIEALLKVINEFLKIYGKPVKISSGLRSLQKHKDIYRSKGIPDDKIPMASGHLTGKSIDFANDDMDQFCSDNQDLLEKLGLWQEHPNATKGWCHLDIIQRPIKTRPNCLKRQFNP